MVPEDPAASLPCPHERCALTNPPHLTYTRAHDPAPGAPAGGALHRPGRSRAPAVAARIVRMGPEALRERGRRPREGLALTSAQG
jgi:hypothetical protein